MAFASSMNAPCNVTNLRPSPHRYVRSELQTSTSTSPHASRWALLALIVLQPTVPKRVVGQPASNSTNQSSQVQIGEPAGKNRSHELDRLIDVQLDSVPLVEAIDRISHAAAIAVTYSATDTDLVTHRVTLRVSGVNAREVFRRVLDGTGLELQVLPSGALILARVGNRNSLVDSTSEGAISGFVLDSTTKSPVSSASIHLDRARDVITGLDGRFQFTHVALGQHILLIHALGYAPQQRSVLVALAAATAITIKLVPSPAVLDRVVTTVTGNQSALQVGNMLGTIAADSIVGKAPITDLSDLLAARVAGVQVYLEGGLTAASPQVIVRGQNSLTLSNQALLYIDGVRVDNSVVAGSPSGQFGLAAGRFNDLVPEEIESIEIVKGPSATTLYGTDAANGVILVKTKRPHGGSRRWSAFTETGVLTIDRGQFPDNYQAWGHSTDGGDSLITCTLLLVAARECIQDSVTHFTPLKVSSLTPLGTGQRQDAGLQVAGGSDVRYFLSGSYEYERGYLSLPQADRSLVETAEGSGPIPDYVLHPNYVGRYAGRANLVTPIGRTADVTVTLSYLQRESSIPIPYALTSALNGPGYVGTTEGWSATFRPADLFINKDIENVDHFTASAAPTWRPSSWLSTHGTFGIDRSNNYEDALTPDGEGLFDKSGFRGNTQADNTVYSADVGATATANVLRGLNAKTSIGGQYTRREDLATLATATNLFPGAQTANGGATNQGQEFSDQSVIAGAYVEEVFGLNDRLYLTIADRLDGASAFGQALRTANYPKASASWLISQESFWPAIPGLSNLRLRGAYGQSGVQPPSTAALALIAYNPTFVDGGAQTGASVAQNGNTNLQPERTREFETGFDIDAVNSRIHIEGTYYYKSTAQAIEQINAPNSIGGTPEYVNIGRVRNWGYEVQASARLVTSTWLDWDLNVNGSVNHNQLVALGSGVSPVYGQYLPSIVVGFPLYSLIDHPLVGYADRNGDHILSANEVDVDTSVERYAGPAFPAVQATVGTTVSLFRNSLHISAQLDHRGAFDIIDLTEAWRCRYSLDCAAVSTAATPLRDQAAAVALTTTGSYWGYYRDGTFTRLRELSLTFDVPQGVSRAVHVRSASLTLSGRNLVLWTKYPGDPEATGNLGYAAYGNYAGLPPARYFIARLNLGL